MEDEPKINQDSATGNFNSDLQAILDARDSVKQPANQKIDKSDPEQAKDAPVQAKWTTVEWTDKYDQDHTGRVVELRLDGYEDAAYFDAALNEDMDGKKILKVGTVSVYKEFKGNNIGEKLAKAMGSIAVNHECDKIDADFRHVASLKQFIKVFGFDRITFFDGDGEEVKMTEEEAIAYVAESRGFNDDNVRLRNIRGLKATIDIKGLDVSGWEAPREFERPEDEY